MRRNRFAVGGFLGVVTVALFVGGVVGSGVLAQGGIQGLSVRNGGGTCREMTYDLRTDPGTWRAPYFNYMAGFVTGANFVSYSVPGRKSNVPLDLPREVAEYSRADEAVVTLLEQYCAQNPAKNISEGAMVVYSRLVTE